MEMKNFSVNNKLYSGNTWMPSFLQQAFFDNGNNDNWHFSIKFRLIVFMLITLLLKHSMLFCELAQLPDVSKII